jgi:apolipoprotein N-acyltransferase
MQRDSWKLWAAAGLSAGLLELPFPLAGPLPPWRNVFAWFGMVPLIWAVLRAASGVRPLRCAFLVAYFAGFLWYCGNCYWVRDTMMRYGDMPTAAPTLLLVGFSLVLGLYFGLFGLSIALVMGSSRNTRLALAAAPAVWVALELAASRITSVPWDQLGYSQVDNGLVNQLAPWTGVYGISFLLVAVNALLAATFLLEGRKAKLISGTMSLVLLAGGWVGTLHPSPAQHTTATAVLIQPNLDVGGDNDWAGPEWNQHMAEFARLAGQNCKTYIAGIPQTGAPQGEIVCPPWAAHPDLVVWPESPAPFLEGEPRVQNGLASVTRAVQAPLVTGALGMDLAPDEQSWRSYNSALVLGADGARVGRYDKIHLVPFGEYVPFQNLLTFARKLTGRVSSFTRGTERPVFRLNGHRYGVFICYESVFADEVRQFARLGAEVLVNISDDGWYGDTSAPWQHLNMARMRAIENRRWLLRDTNNGVTAAIDPYGRVRQSIPRHQVDALPAEFGFRSDVTFYSAHGDVFAWLCAILAMGLVAWALRARLRLAIQIKVRS